MCRDSIHKLIYQIEAADGLAAQVQSMLKGAAQDVTRLDLSRLFYAFACNRYPVLTGDL